MAYSLKMMINELLTFHTFSARARHEIRDYENVRSEIDKYCEKAYFANMSSPYDIAHISQQILLFRV